MKAEHFKITRNVIKDYFVSLKRDDVRKWAVTSGRFLNQNKKLAKGDNYNVGLELLPSTLSGKRGVNLCGKETSCLRTCLVFSGKGNLLNQRKMIDGGVITPMLATRAKRTWLYLNDQEFFFNLLNNEIDKAKMLASALGKKLAIRLNVFTDIDWSEFISTRKDVQFYDYTKHWDREGSENYSITYSFSEKITLDMANEKITAGNNIAMVFPSSLPESWNNIPVINGDESDSRYADSKGIIIGLVLKTPIGKKIDYLKNKFLRVA